jgi:hypothetical protein
VTIRDLNWVTGLWTLAISTSAQTQGDASINLEPERLSEAFVQGFEVLPADTTGGTGGTGGDTGGGTGGTGGTGSSGTIAALYADAFIPIAFGWSSQRTRLEGV